MNGFAWFALFGLTVLICIVVEARTKPEIPRADRTRRRRWPTNLAFCAINIGLAFVIPVSSATMAKYAEQTGIGLLHAIETPYWIDFTATILIASLGSYVFHRLHHNVPLLWRFHRVHHSDNDLDWSSALCNHPVEVLAAIFWAASLAVAFGLNATALFVHFLLNYVIDFVSHARFKLPSRIERVLQWAIVTPQLHHIHHSSWQPETDSNYGGDFSIWDRLFGTLNPAPLRPIDRFAYGIDTLDPAYVEDLDWLLLSPLQPGGTDWAETPELARTYRP